MLHKEAKVKRRIVKKESSCIFKKDFSLKNKNIGNIRKLINALK